MTEGLSHIDAAGRHAWSTWRTSDRSARVPPRQPQEVCTTATRAIRDGTVAKR